MLPWFGAKILARAFGADCLESFTKVLPHWLPDENDGPVARVLRIPELLENILGGLEMEDLFLLQRVNRTFKAAINSSIHLRRIMCLQDVDYEECLECNLHRGLHEDLYIARCSRSLHRMCAILGEVGLITSPPAVDSLDPREDLKWDITADHRCLLEPRKDGSWGRIQAGSQRRRNTVDFYFHTPTRMPPFDAFLSIVTLGPETTLGDIVDELQKIFLNAVRVEARERKTSILATINYIRTAEEIEAQIEVMRAAGRRRLARELEHERWSNIACTVATGLVALSTLALCVWLFLRAVTAAIAWNQATKGLSWKQYLKQSFIAAFNQQSDQSGQLFAQDFLPDVPRPAMLEFVIQTWQKQLPVTEEWIGRMWKRGYSWK
ncbi:Putative F-box-like domain superfamily protein [Septoria linicola]|uniref:F-box-like domain superfamily protein n=1 Tax=Septoria linicola TaxID=215465 RepID=A0A9Q9EL64_9PEZI|nr:Putative F-box-like domain superfamily protein [Septoria linicola]